MAKDKITDYDSVASNNLDVGGISVAEGMLPSGVNNSIRELMSHQKEAFGSGTPLYVDQTNNRVGVGNAAPETVLHTQTNTGDTAIFNNSVAGLGIVASRNTSTSGIPGLALRSWSTWTSPKDTGQIRFDGLTSTGAYTEYGSIYLSSLTNTSSGAASTMKFATSDGTGSATERLRILPTGGITFNGDTAQANALDDYEEGTWTPTSIVNGFTVSLSNFNAARYVKIGKIVHVTFDLVFGSATYASSYSHVGGLPFGSATAAVNGWYSSGSISGNAAGGPIFIGSGTTSVFLFQGINSNQAISWNVGFTYETT